MEAIARSNLSKFLVPDKSGARTPDRLPKLLVRDSGTSNLDRGQRTWVVCHMP